MSWARITLPRLLCHTLLRRQHSTRRVVRKVKRLLFLHLTDHPSLILVLQAKKDIASTGTGSRIVFVSATYFQTGLPLQTHVAVAKFAVNAWSNNLAIEMGPLGVTSNIIAPGPIGASEGMNRLTPASDADKDGSSRIPLGKQGSVKDIADATVYLFSDAANYVNGDVLIGIDSSHLPADQLRQTVTQWTEEHGTQWVEPLAIPCLTLISCSPTK